MPFCWHPIQNIHQMDKNHVSTIKRSILNLDHFTSQPGKGLPLDLTLAPPFKNCQLFWWCRPFWKCYSMISFFAANTLYLAQTIHGRYLANEVTCRANTMTTSKSSPPSCSRRTVLWAKRMHWMRPARCGKLSPCYPCISYPSKEIIAETEVTRLQVKYKS